MNKKFKLKRENPTIENTGVNLKLQEIERFFRDEEITDLQKYTFTFVTKKREK